jgi:hypothetical protein
MKKGKANGAETLYEICSAPTLRFRQEVQPRETILQHHESIAPDFSKK